MLPNRAIVRLRPSLGLQRQIQGRRVSPPPGVPSSKLGISNGRQFSALRSSQLPCLASTLPIQARNVAGPKMLGGTAGSRQFSLWGLFGKKTAAENGSNTTAPTLESTALPDVDDVARPVHPTVDQAPLSTNPPEPVVSASELDLSSISDIVNGEAILNLPEQIGYLSALGLDYGWGPTSIMQWTLEHVHIYTGLGWGASIMTTAVLLRCLMFYPQIRSSKFNAVMQNVQKDPRSKEAMKLIQQGLQTGDMEMRQRGQYLHKMLKEQYGASGWGMLWAFCQIPFTFGLFRIVSGMTNIPVPAMETAGYLWFPDLTATDPYFILPAVGTALMVGALAINAKYTPERQRKMLKTMTYVFGVVGFIGTTFLSAAVNLMTVALGAATLVTSVVLNNSSVRRVVGLPLHAPQTTPSNSATYQAPRAVSTSQAGLRDRLNTNLNDMKKGLSEQISSYTGTYSGTEEDKAEKKRRELIRKLEESRKQQEREEFEKKYKGKR